MELLNILESSLTRVLSTILSCKVQSRVLSPPGDPKKCLKWQKCENQNDFILNFISRKGADDVPKHQIYFSPQSGRLWKNNIEIKGWLKVK